MRDFHLLIDVGNTFLKWGLFQPSEKGGARENRLESGHALLEEIPALPAQFAKYPAPTRIVISNVAGTRVRAATIRVLEVWPDAPAPHWLVPRVEQCGVTNSYRNPAQLGSDRWAALIGARARHAQACLVVCAGTATTIDVLDAEGNFQGGLILPGVAVMCRALAASTAQLPLAAGRFAGLPRNTADAIVSGCLQAQAGAIERMFEQVAGHPGATCLVSGGAAPQFYDLLRVPKLRVDNLVLEGLARIGGALTP